MAELLSSKDYGEKLYNSLPPMYRSADEEVNLALKRYLQALGDGGYSHVIEELNGLLNLQDPEKTPEEVLAVAFKHYGLEVFQGIPESYLRKLLVSIGDIYARKGTTTVIEYLTSLISNVKSEVELRPDFNTNYGVDIRLEMDYGISPRELPDMEHLQRIIEGFIPFFCSVTVIYVYLFFDTGYIKREGSELLDIFSIGTLNSEVKDIPLSDSDTTKVNLLTAKESFKVVSPVDYTGCMLNRAEHVTNSTFYLNRAREYDKVNVRGKASYISTYNINE